MKRFIFSLYCLLSGALAWAQKPVLSTPVARQSDTDIIVEYTLQMELGVSCDIALYLSCDGGRTYSKTALKQVSGDVGTVRTSGPKTIVWHALDEEEALTGDNLTFKVNVERFWSNVESTSRIDEVKGLGKASPVIGSEKKTKISRQKPVAQKMSSLLIAPVIGVYPDISYGAMAGWIGDKFGAYGKFRSNFVNTGSSYDCTSDGRAGSGYFWATGESKIALMSFTAGVVLPVGRTLYPYAGVGYANRELAWKDVSGKWARVSDISISGIGLEAGLLLRFGNFGIHGSANVVGLKKLGADAGLALFF